MGFEMPRSEPPAKVEKKEENPAEQEMKNKMVGQMLQSASSLEQLKLAAQVMAEEDGTIRAESAMGGEKGSVEGFSRLVDTLMSHTEKAAIGDLLDEGCPGDDLKKAVVRLYNQKFEQAA